MSRRFITIEQPHMTGLSERELWEIRVSHMATNGKLWFPYHDRLTVSEIGREFNPSTDRRPRT